MGQKRRKPRRDVIVGRPKRQVPGGVGSQSWWMSRKIRPRSRVTPPKPGSKLPRTMQMPVWAPAPFYYQAVDPNLMKRFRRKDRNRKLRVI